MPAVNNIELLSKGFLDSFTSAITDIFNTVLLPAVNNQLTNVAILGAHVLGGLSQENDIIGTLGTLFGKRGIFDDLLGSLTQSLTSAANQILSEASLSLAIALAQFGLNGGIGGVTGRDIDTNRFFDALTNAFLDIFNTVLLPAVNNQLTNVAILGAHVLGGLSQENDIIGTLGTLFGKRGIFDDLLDGLMTSITGAANQLLAEASLQLAIALAQFSMGGGLLGRDVDQKGIFDSLTASLTDIFNTVLLPAVNNQLTNIAILGAHVLGGLSQENDIIGTLGTLFGKRALENKGFWDELGNTLLGSVVDAGNQLLGSVSLQLAISLAQFGLGGGLPPIGK